MEEKELIDYVETGQPESVPNVAEEISRYQSIAHTQITKKKAISIRLLDTYKECASMKETMYLLSSKNNSDRLLDSIEEIKKV